MNEMTKIAATTTLKDWETDQEVRWCPGCGDYAILKAVQRTLPELGADPANTVFVSGIGCSSRFPYYVESYGFHTIHGRAPAFATGIKLANPELDVWLVTGDGDGMSIGGNHTMHVLRRNLDCQILLFNNEIYGLTKGQYSPTSREGTTSPTTPLGSVDRPASPCAFALGAGARFIARGFDVSKNLPEVLKAAYHHRGAAFVEIFQNCIVYNKDVFNDFAAPKGAEDRQLWLTHGEPMLFAKGTQGIALDTEKLTLKVVDVVDGDWQSAGVIVHDVTNRSIAHMLVEMPFGAFPMALGVLYDDPRPTFEAAVAGERAKASAGKEANLAKLLAKGQTWTVTEGGPDLYSGLARASMDNLTHSLIGAALGQAGLKRKTGLAMPALIIGANIPDIDAACFFWLEGTEHLGFRRGITHGPPAMLLLPLVLAGLLWWFDRWQTGRGTRPEGRLPVSFKWLYLLGLIGCLSHPLFDWFNNYGIRLLEPFSSQWFYGDTLFIIDIWIWAMLGAGIWLSRRRERSGRAEWTRPAVLSLRALTLYILLNMGISAQAIVEARKTIPQAKLIAANQVPLAFWERQVLVRTDKLYGTYSSTPFGALKGQDSPKPINMDDPRIAAWAKGDPQAEAFLFWSRMPIAEPSPKGILLKDQRFLNVPSRSTFQVELKPKP